MVTYYGLTPHLVTQNIYMARATGFKYDYASYDSDIKLLQTMKRE